MSHLTQTPDLLTSHQPAGGTAGRKGKLLILVLFMRAFATLVLFDRYVRRGDFAGLYERVRGCAINDQRPSVATVEQICAAANLACIWYWKEVLCLERSAVTTYLLKRHGAPAQMIIGARQIPFEAHAWVELDGRVINDKPYVRDVYVVLDRC